MIGAYLGPKKVCFALSERARPPTRQVNNAKPWAQQSWQNVGTSSHRPHGFRDWVRQQITPHGWMMSLTILELVEMNQRPCAYSIFLFANLREHFYGLYFVRTPVKIALKPASPAIPNNNPNPILYILYARTVWRL